jgi:hypothetical protein
MTQFGKMNSWRQRFDSLISARIKSLAVISVLSAGVVLGACTNSAGNLTSSGSGAAGETAANALPTVPPASSAGSDAAGSAAIGSTATDVTVAIATVVTTTTIPVSTIPPTTIPHGDGVAQNLKSGEPYDEDAYKTAQSIYEAAITHDYARLRDIIGDRRFRWGAIGERRPTEAWQKSFDEGGPDELARMAKMLEIPPGVNSRGEIVWPYVAVKDPATWDAEDEALLAKLGFNPEDIVQTKSKGRYVDFRLIIDQKGIWTTFAVGY